MRKSQFFTYIIILMLSCITFELTAQVSLNSANIKSTGNAMLDIYSTDKGLLIPRLSEEARNLIPSPATGLLIYNTSTNLFNYYNGDYWFHIETAFVTATKGTNSPGGGVSISALPSKLPDNSAMLDASDPTRGFLLTRTTQESIVSPENGLIIYDTVTRNLKYYYDFNWFPVCSVTTLVHAPTGSQDSVGVAINTTGASPHHSAILDVSSPDKGTLIPRLTSVQRDSVLPVTGLTIFNTITKEIEYYNGSVWLRMNIISPASVTISASSLTVCAGTLVTFTATPLHGGQPPLYQWFVNSLLVSGATNVTYSYAPANDDTITCEMTSTSPCAIGSPATSNAIHMAVNSLLTVGISITPSASTVCAGTPVTFNSTVINGGLTPTYQWKVNGIAVSGATNVAYTYEPLNNDAITCVVTSNATCATGNPATSNVVTMTVNPLLPVSISVTPSANPVCAGISVTFNTSVVNGGLSPVYQWMANGSPVSGATSATYTYNPVNHDAISCVVTSDATCATGSPATSNVVTMTVNPLLPVSISISPSANPVCAGTAVTFDISVTNGGEAPTFQWRVNGLPVSGATSNAYTYEPLDHDAITCVLTSDATCATGNPATSNVVTMTVNPLLPVSISISPSANPVCAGTSVIFSSAIIHGGPAPAYQWKLNGTNLPGATNTTYTFVANDNNNNDEISCVLVSNATCATGSPAVSNVVTMTVNPLLPVSISISPSANPVCSGTSVTFSSVIIHGGSVPGYQWKLNGTNLPGATNASYSFVAADNNDNNTISCVLISNATCATGSPAVSNVVTMTVNPLLPVSISISPSANPVCSGTPVTFSSAIIHGGPAPLYQWKLNGANLPGATNATYSFTANDNNDNNEFSCVVISNATCATGSPAVSNVVTMKVNPLLPVSISISPSANPVCSGTSVTFSSAIIHGGAAPLYQWKLNGANLPGATNTTYTFIANDNNDNNEISCMLVSNATCATGSPAISNVVTMTVNPLLPVSISISPSANPVCSGTSVTFSSAIIHGGPVPLYQWKLNGANLPGATNATYTFTANDNNDNNEISCVVISNATCATGSPAVSNVVTMKVNPLLPVSISISPSANQVCAGTSVTFSSAIVNGGIQPLYQWKLNGTAILGATANSYTYTPLNNDAISCVLTSNATCATGTPASSNVVSMVVNPLLPVSITVTPSVNPVCAGFAVTFSTTIVNGGSSPSYLWKVNGAIISGATSSSYSYVPINNDQVVCVLTSNATCATGTPATSNTIIVSVTPNPTASITIATAVNPVCAGTSVTFTSSITGGGPTPGYQWKVNGINAGTGNFTFIYTPLANDVISCVLTSSRSCVTGSPATSNSITMGVNPLLPVSLSVAPSANPVCAGTQVTFSTSIVNGGTLPQYQWKLNGTNITGGTNATYTFVPSNGNALSCVLTSNAICATGSPATSNVVTMTVNPNLPASITIAASANQICAGTLVTFSSTIINGGSAPQYQWKSGSTNITGATNATYTFAPANGNAITCVLTSNATCATGSPATSNVVTMIVNPLAPVSINISPSANPVCPGTLVNFTSSIGNGGSAPTYQWSVNGMAVAGATNTTYSYTVVNSDIITCVLTSNATCAVGTPATSNTVSMTVNPFLPVSITIVASTPIVTGTDVTFTATPVNGGLTPIYQWKVNGVNAGTNSSTFTYTPAIIDQITCVLISSASCAIGTPATSNTIIITDAPPVPVSITITPSANPVCAGTSVTFTAAPVNEGATPAYQWKLAGANINGATNPTYSYIPANNNAISCVLTSTTGTVATSNTITMSVIPPVPVSVTITASVYAVVSVPVTPVTFTATPVNGGTSPAYQWKVNSANVGTNSNTFTYNPTDHDKVTCVVTSNYNATCLSNNPATSNTIIMIVYTTGTPCSIPTIQYGGLTYNTVQIGTQCWLRENLNIGTLINTTVEQSNNSVLEKYCYGNSEMNCNVYGGLYQWAEMVQYLNGATNNTNWSPVPTGNVQGICPSGWHIPTNDEWLTLTTALGGLPYAGGKLKETSYSHFLSPNVGATNTSGFTALPAGLRWSSGGSYYLNTDATFWTTTSGLAATDIYVGGASYSVVSADDGQFYKVNGVSVRCLKN